MPAEDPAPTFDPRFDPVYQRGYVGASGVRSGPASDAVVRPVAGDAVGPAARSAVGRRGVGAVHGDGPSVVEQSFVAESAPDLQASADDHDDDIDPFDQPDDAWTLLGVRRRPGWWPMLTLWLVGIALVVLGSLSLANGVRLNLEFSQGFSSDSPYLLESQVSWALVQPAFIVGLATIVGTVGLHFIVPADRRRS